jgi:anti-sigma B factor antagonist
MEIRERTEEGILFLRPVIEHLDVPAAAELKTILTDRVTRGARNIALNLQDVEFMDSSGLGALISTLRLLECQGELMLCGVRDGVLGLLRITSMVRVLSLYENEAEVLAERSGRLL